MIESNIIQWLDFGDSTQILDVYSKRKQIAYFKFLRYIVINNNYSIIINIILTFLYFTQIWTICLINVSIEKEFLLDIINYLKNITVLYELITNTLSYKRMIIIIFVIILLDIILIIIVFFYRKKKNISYICLIVNLLNLIICYYLIGPAVEICLISVWCENNSHKYLRITCYSNLTHLGYTVFSFIILLFYILLSFINSFYCNEIDLIKIKSQKNISRIQCNYELYCLISKISIFIYGFFFYKFDYEEEEHLYVKIVYELFIFFICFIMSLYSYKKVYFYNSVLNYINHFGWYFSTWFTLGIVLKTSLNLIAISNFIIIGWIIIIFTLSKAYQLKENILVTEENIFEFNNIYLIEIYKNIILTRLSDKHNNNSKIFIFGIIKKFEDFAIDNPEINYQYKKILNDKNLSKKYNKEDTLPILAIIFTLYSFYYEKYSNDEEIVFHMCYFLINKLDNISYAMLLCSKLKAKNHKTLYYKYLLIEDIKNYLISKLKKNSNKESIKNVQLGSVILYYSYIDLFKMKIYDAISNQIEYFDLLKNNIVTNKTTENFLKTGENIFRNRKEILKIWEKIIDLNPFSDECYRDYILYLDSIIQDEALSRKASKKYMLLKNNKLKEKFNIYYSMFIKDISAVLLIDGYLSNGKILYASQNFPFLFTYNGKELIGLTIDDLIPNVIQPFHKELIDHAIKYSNIKYIFNKPKNSLMKNKNGGLINIKLFIKPVPNLYYGLIYFSYLQKVHDPNFYILLDKELKISGFTDMSQIGSSYTMNNGFNLNRNIIGNHIGLILPEIFPLIVYKNGEFNLKETDYELKGNLYSVEQVKEINNKLENILNKIKNNSTYIKDYQEQFEDDYINIRPDLSDFISELKEESINCFSIFYKIKLCSFLDGKYKYYKLTINNDIMSENELCKKINKNYKLKSTMSKKTKESRKKIKIKIDEIIDRLIINRKIKNNFDDSTLCRNSKNINEINKKEADDNDKKEEQNNNKNTNEKIKEKKNKEKEKKINELGLVHLNYTKSYNSKINIILKRYYNLKTNIINKKETFPLRIIKYLCYSFAVASIVFMIIDCLNQRDSFKRLTDFIEQHLFFNAVKICVGALYSICINIRFLSHSLYMNSVSHLNEEWSSFHQNLLEENMKVLIEFKDSISSNIEFLDKINERHQIEIYFYKYEEADKVSFDLNNLFYYLVNNGIKIMDTFDYFVDNNCNEISKELGLNEINLKNLIEQSFFFYNFSFNVDTIEEIKKNKKAEKVIYYFPFPLVITFLFLLLLLIIFIYNIMTLYNIGVYFLDKLINFNSTNFDNYLKNLEEIKKKLKNDNSEEDDKGGDINLKDEEDIEGAETLEDIQSNDKEEKKKISKKDREKLNKIQQQRRKKFNLMKSFFQKNNFYIQVKVIFILLASFTYFILAILFKSKFKNEFMTFYELRESFDKVYIDAFDIYIMLKRELDLYESNLINCNTIGQFKPMNIPKINEIITPKFGNLIMKITSGSDFDEETLNKFIRLYENNACNELIENLYEIEYCNNFWSGVMLKGMGQAITQMDVVISSVIDELQSLNDLNNRTLISLIKESSFIEYSQFMDYYYYKACMTNYNIFIEFSNEKLKVIRRVLLIILLIYILISLCLFTLLIYFVYNFNSIFNTFLNFIGILPGKYFSEDQSFYNEIVKFGEKYY